MIMHSITENYHELQTLFLAAFDSLVKDGFVPTATENPSYTEKDIAGFKKDLVENKFIVSVCGQIKAGKSSLLNFLLFDLNKPALPVAPTPWTAKLTKIVFGEKDRARVHFYSTAEWEMLRTAMVTDEDNEEAPPVNYFEKYLRPDLEKSAAAGVFDREYILSAPKVVELERLEQLADYVGSKGQYTPFVSTVEVFVHNEALRDVVIVDTPGINDPNELRSKATTEFINQSSAVVYLFHSTIPMGKADLVFIDRHLASVPPSRIVFGMAKSDRVKDIEVIRKYIEGHLRNNADLKERNLLRDGKVYPFSTMAAVIRRKRELGLPLTENEAYFEGITQPLLIQKGGMMGDLFEAIEKHIMQDKAEGVLEAAYERVKSVCIARINAISAAIGSKEQIITDLELSAAGLEEKIRKVKSVRDLIDRLIADSERQKTRLLIRLREEILEKKDLIRPRARASFSAWLDNRKAREAIQLSGFEVQRILTEEIKLQVSDTVADAFFKELEDFQQKLKAQLKEETKEVLPFNRYGFIFAPVIPLRQILSNSLDVLKEMPAALEKLREAILGFTRENRTKVNITAAVFAMMDGPVSDFCSTLNAGINKELQEFFLQLTEEVRGFLNQYQQNLNDLSADSTDKSEQVEAARQALLPLQTELERSKRAFASIESEAGAKWRIYQSKSDRS